MSFGVKSCCHALLGVLRMKKSSLRSGLIKLFEEASFLGFAIILVGSSIVLASTISSRSNGFTPGTGAQERVALDNNIALSVEIVGGNAKAKSDTGASVLYNGEKTDLRVYYGAEGGAVTAGSRAVIAMPDDDGLNEVFFSSDTSETAYPQTVNILNRDGTAIGSATVSARGTVEINFSRALPEGEGGVFTIDGLNVFILSGSDNEEAVVEFSVGNPGSAAMFEPLASPAWVLANSKGIGVSQEALSVDWAGEAAYADGVPMGLTISYHLGVFGAANGDLLQLRLPGRGADVVFSREIASLNVMRGADFVGVAGFSSNDGRDAADLNVVFNALDGELASGVFTFPMRCDYAGGYAGGEAAYGVPVVVTGGDALVLTRAALRK
jgi:hypothetical protein